MSALAPERIKCAATKANGQPCGANPAKGTELCAGHLGLGIASNPQAYAKEANRRSATVRAERAEARKMGFTDVLAAKLHAESEALADRWIAEGKQDWRATEGALTRLYGKPKETLELSGGLDLTALSRDERDALVRKALEEPAIIDALPESYRVKLALQTGNNC